MRRLKKIKETALNEIMVMTMAGASVSAMMFELCLNRLATDCTVTRAGEQT